MSKTLDFRVCFSPERGRKIQTLSRQSVEQLFKSTDFYVNLIHVSRYFLLQFGHLSWYFMLLCVRLHCYFMLRVFTTIFILWRIFEQFVYSKLKLVNLKSLQLVFYATMCMLKLVFYAPCLSWYFQLQLYTHALFGTIYVH